MPSVSVDVDVNLAQLCDLGDLKRVVGYALLATDARIKKSAENLNHDLDLLIRIGDANCPLSPIDKKYLEWKKERDTPHEPEER